MRKTILTILWVSIASSHAAPARDLSGVTMEGTPYAGERLDYMVEWTGLDVGKLTLLDHGMVEEYGGTFHKLVVYGKTTGAVEHLYDSRRQFIGFMTPHHRPFRYEEWEKEDDDWIMEEWLSFLFDIKEVRRIKHEKLRNILAIQPNYFDPVTAGYRLRAHRMKPGDFVEATVTQGKYIYRITTTVEKGEIMQTILGPRETLVIVPKIYWKGKLVRNRDIKVWLTDDEKQIPVKAFADVEYGSFTATLTKYDEKGAEKVHGKG
ncbi:MAG: DUF3108 domain-containing protein [Candidatus Omnitrophica bacterium]|nr:DUF3108 domain-containing protein [Candidatus Omnitrophota bacterium]